MFGLSRYELRFALVISTAHLTQHFLMRLLPPLIPVLAVALDYPLWQLGLLISIYSVGGGIAQAPLGILSDRYDRLYILPTGIVIASLSYLIFALSPTIGNTIPGLSLLGYSFAGGFIVMVVSMLGVGIGAAVVHPTAYPLITDNIDRENKGKVIGGFGSFAKIGDALSPTIIGVLILVLVWEQIILVLGTIGVLVGIALYLLLRGDEFTTNPVAEDHPQGVVSDTTSENIWQADNRTYLYPLLVIYVFIITKMIPSNGLNAFLPVFIVGVYGYSTELVGVSMGAESIANFYFATLLFSAAFSQLILGAVTDRYDPRTVILICLGVSTIGLLVLALFDLSKLPLLVVIIVLGGSLWGTNPARDTLISNITPPDREGRTFGYIWTFVQLTGALIPVLVGYIIDLFGYREGFLLLTGGAVLSFVSVSLLFSSYFYVTNSM
ncbi:MFS transporter [Natrialba sp. INN-245]|uniref:MFS transporter n=1 Tax=Natrialba sp. INN-245 TaxID=2690967 RepID=UPI0013122846|nr:MFS transporter [Natrialba sp. INN-245]MWV39978.1 MFS transporter [Natrialba sp. INN-245]